MYIPNNCLKGVCNLHIAVHGCSGKPPLEKIAGFDKFLYIKYGATNDIINLYPMVKECWDLSGYTGEHFADKNGI